MSLDSVLIISFLGILIGIILLLFSNDEKIESFVILVKNKSGRVFSIFEKLYKKRLDESIDVNTYDLRFYAQIIDLAFIGMLLILIEYYSQENYILIVVLASIIVFFLPLAIWEQSIGQKFMHLKVYNWNNEPIKEFDKIFLRYILKYLIFPISLATFLKSKMLMHDIIFKTYEKQC